MTNDIVTKMLEIEKRAKSIVSEANIRKEHIEEEINSETEKMTTSYINRANLRVQKVMDFENRSAEEKLENIRKDTEKSMAKIKQTYETNKEKWINDLYDKIVGR